jgi:hypothetical protein
MRVEGAWTPHVVGRGGSPGLRAQVVPERGVATGVRLGVDQAGNHVEPRCVDRLPSGGQKFVLGDGHDLALVDGDPHLSGAARADHGPALDYEIDLTTVTHPMLLLT